jgi:uncharacterized protein
MHQKWRDLLFLHFPEDPGVVQALLPPGLEVDTFPDESGEEKAWIGLVPFRMEGVRAVGMPALPGLSAFPETNVRTYVHAGGAAPGVWFFSLDAANEAACNFARRFFSLPYWYAKMAVERDGDRLVYLSERRARGAPTAEADIHCKALESMSASAPGTLVFFLVERYLLYAENRGRLFTGQVHHRPYPLRKAALKHSHERLLQAAGIQAKPWTHTCFSEGVDVEIFPIRALDRVRPA